MKKQGLFIPALFLSLLFACKKEDLSNLDASEKSKKPESTPTLEQRISAIADSFVMKNKLPGISVYVMQPNSTISVQAGYSDLTSKTLWKKEMPGFAQSISKTFTAVAILQLCEKGKLRLDDPIKKYLKKSIVKSITGGDCITIRQLLNHSSGIRDYVEELEFQDAVFSGAIFPLTYQKTLPFIYNKPLNFKSGTSESYSNTNYTLLALIIDKAAEQSHCRFIKENIVDKISLKHTHYLPNGNTFNNLIKAYSYNEETTDYDDVTSLQLALTEGMIGDDGIASTSKDLALFYKALLEDKTLITSSSLRQMLNFEGLNGNRKYGLGIIRNINPYYGLRIGHSGAGLGAGAEAWYIERTKSYIVIMTNVGTVFDGIASTNFDELTDKIFQEVSQ